MLLMVNGELVEPVEGSAAVAAWIKQVKTAKIGNCIGAHDYLLARKYATASQRADMDAFTINKLRIASVKKAYETSTTGHVGRGINIARNWLADFATNPKMPEPVRKAARDSLPDDYLG